MRPIYLALALSGLVGLAFGGEIDELRDEYDAKGIKIPTNAHFTSNYSSRFFSAAEIGNTANTGKTYFLANTAFWWAMDEFRDDIGIIITSSAYRNPVHNKKEGGKKKSMHQYGGATDVWKVNGVKWEDMSTERQNEIIIQLGVIETVMQNTYGDEFYFFHESKSDHLHIHLMNYCAYPGNYDHS